MFVCVFFMYTLVTCMNGVGQRVSLRVKNICHRTRSLCLVFLLYEHWLHKNVIYGALYCASVRYE